MISGPPNVNVFIVEKETPKIVGLAVVAVFWILLVGGVGISRIWFGGSFLLELIAGVFAVIALVEMAKRANGVNVKMSKVEAKIWLDAGAPPNVRAWREARQLTQDNGRG